MSNKHTVKRNIRLRRKAGERPGLSEFARRMLAHIDEERARLQRIASRSQQ